VNDATLAASLLAVDPGLGACLRGPSGPASQSFLASLRAALPDGAPWRKVPAGVTDDRLLGGLDLAATLAAGRRVAEAGLLAQADGGLVIIAMAERLDPGIAARLGNAMDTGLVVTERDGMSQQTPSRFGVIALDEGIDEAAPASLTERLALHLSADAYAETLDEDAITAARARLPAVSSGEGSAEALVVACAQLGISSLRAPLHGLRTARAAAALAGRDAIAEEDLQAAARLVLASRATVLPPPPDQPPEPPPPDPEPDTDPDPQQQDQQAGRLADTIAAAASAAMPADLLAALAKGVSLRARAGGVSGATRRNAQRGRTVGTKPGDPRGGARLHLLATLRAAAPWQKLRAADAKPGRIAIRRADFRLRRFHQSTRTTTIFVVDASGSAAVARLAEAKGAVETLLAECYVRRDRVALLTMRGQDAEILLPPTSSLARAKRSLAGMPGGGGTPLAHGFVAALMLADGVKRGGQTPVAVFLTDGRPNVALNGAHGRPAAEADALITARAWGATGHAALLVDMARRPHPFARTLADAASATYLALPIANAALLQDAVRAAVSR
jgi:magnesium chelatase subunit D